MRSFSTNPVRCVSSSINFSPGVHCVTAPCVACRDTHRLPPAGYGRSCPPARRCGGSCGSCSDTSRGSGSRSSCVTMTCGAVMWCMMQPQVLCNFLSLRFRAIRIASRGQWTINNLLHPSSNRHFRARFLCDVPSEQSTSLIVQCGSEKVSEMSHPRPPKPPPLPPKPHPTSWHSILCRIWDIAPAVAFGFSANSDIFCEMGCALHMRPRSVWFSRDALLRGLRRHGLQLRRLRYGLLLLLPPW